MPSRRAGLSTPSTSTSSTSSAETPEGPAPSVETPEGPAPLLLRGPATDAPRAQAVLGAYVAYFYLIEQPGLVEEEPPKALPSGVHRALPDGRLLMADGSIRAAAAPESTAGFVAAPTFAFASASSMSRAI